MIEHFEDLPASIREHFKQLYPGKDNAYYEDRVSRKIPALKGKSIVETINEPGGEKRVISMLNEASAAWGGPFIDNCEQVKKWLREK
ncbi:MAG: hypothetical protein HQL30_03230 [Candidatus Omnitrophica bacterium]|nr:hypothetical protein [Candidatus Omnitrophota bacterium]